ncbi:Glutathione synthetase, chloroplastic [Capsicum chinense]|nr:Glutathione synthetase, chloroplastic [Capsicum chinense]
MAKMLILMGQDPVILVEASKYSIWLIPALFGGLGKSGASIASSFLVWTYVALVVFYIIQLNSCERTQTPVYRDAFLANRQFFCYATPSALIVCLKWWSFEVLIFLSGVLPNPKLETSVPSIWYKWKARLLMEQSHAVKCPSISYHLAGTKKIQQELTNPNVLERFLENKDDIAKLQKRFAGLWILDESDTAKDAIERPKLYVMKPQQE